ncbi:hemoglobin/transferrin/lactoferrin receptor protein [Pseudoalteromonas tunicata]|uniref:Outer membrane receptor for ferrienterochelin and colicins n=1 Tax=Pseudoalteromonas tunicata D2 TaxID=87626 RepID=A4C714_9GAMM|nr:hemoglobin/transferrin/lactoferrin receptor protein [Pseudoalteromonas tunicata]EAR29768.1 Outer membrane receptor for ferrienterochelin and colicins [Pseudoalteromonas tunicata D2]
MVCCVLFAIFKLESKEGFFIKALLISSLLLSATALYGAEGEDIFDLSFEELLAVNIELASKTSETLQSVPSTVTVISKQQIENLAVNNAYDLINFIPGFQSTRGDWVGAVPKEHARGVYLDSGNLLVMINGERLNEFSFGKASVYTPFIPTSILEKVEVIRGPGSALYGSNAFIGVINFVTKKHENQVIVGIGEHGLAQMSANWHQQLTQNSKAFVNLAVDKSQGEQYTDFNQVKDPLDAVYFELGLSVNKWHFNGRYNQVNLDQFLNLGGFSAQNRHKSENNYLSAQYQWWQSAQSSLSSKFFYGLHKIASSGMIIPAEAQIVSEPFFVGPFWRTRELAFNTDYQNELSQTLSLTSGFELKKVEQLQAGIYTSHFDTEQQRTIPDDNYWLGGPTRLSENPEFAGLKKSLDQYSAYGQFKWHYSNDLTIFLGARFDDVVSIESKVSPRLAAVFSGIKSHTIKFQYGESFRTPVTNELYSNDEVTSGNPALTSEFVKTTELVWQYHNQQFNSELVFFSNDLNDFINKVATPNGPAEFTFANVIDKKIQGLESSLNWHFSSGLELGVNITNLFDKPANASFKHFASTFINYRIESLLFSVNANWRDGVNVALDNGMDFSQSAYLLFGGSVQWQLSDKSKLSLKATNLLDKQFVVFDPRMDDGQVPGQGRQTRITYQYSF